jgi:hypothetical protein
VVVPLVPTTSTFEADVPDTTNQHVPKGDLADNILIILIQHLTQRVSVTGLSASILNARLQAYRLNTRRGHTIR